ncbi:MAG: tRNA preQ1(34) S-adenosylmethionine ribosyltransferase-isomerase QueA [Deltaproteobacteria bacterium]|nr:tRNA preQ1(34) S-adenosylmethionine ribosyltransferase-isomerase QueA [Deltaproteobacteria bacterium]
MYNIDDYNYDLPGELIAQEPVPERDHSRLLRVDRSGMLITDHHFFQLPDLLSPGDLLVANNTRVVPARLLGRKESGGQVEVLVLEHPDDETLNLDTRWCLLKASKRPQKGRRLFFDRGISGLIEDVGEDGLTRIIFQGDSSIDQFMDEHGQTPLPPYIKRSAQDGRSSLDRDRYQTIFSSRKGAVAAPTAGLHFTKRLLDRLRETGVSLIELTLHVGHGTFRPVRTRDIRDHQLGEETYIIGPDTADVINHAKKQGRRVIAVGTTVVRALESVAGENGAITPGRGKTGLLITPGYSFKIVGGLITNFHLPRSSLLFLVSALAGLDLVRDAYSWAIEKRYRFYSYGDAMLIL